MPDIARQHLLAKRYKDAEQAAIELLTANPLHAQAWVYLGEALLHQGYVGQARRALDRGWLLDPQATWTGRVERALRNRDEGPTNAEVERILDLPPVTVTAAIMTHNDERCIERCINSLVDAVDEILLLAESDTTDRTIELAERLPKVRVIRDVNLDHNFAGKRNKGLEYVRTDWVLWVDADEWLLPEDLGAVREAASLFQHSRLPAILNICQVNYIQGKVSSDYSIPRMIPMSRGLRYHGRVHEQILVQGSTMYDTVAHRQSVRIRLGHDGYEPHILQAKGKLNRNIALLELMVEEEPDNPGWMLFYGRETLGAGDVDKALSILQQAEEIARRTPRFARMSDILMLQHKIYMSRQEYEQAERVCLRAIEADPSFPDAKFQLAQAQMRRAVQLLKSAEEQLNASKTSFHSYRGMVSADRDILHWRADLALADLARMSGNPQEAIRRYETLLQKYPHLKQVKAKLEKLKGISSP
ncbi:tetratricopeptide repeat-containing glycosyltransferase [Paenibacillus koleovorans]|uniref:tetratricopeptide repeat-containing glycosyltransferase n=1 Tax=Paenibacillus koleovorans TaxID=121608 RepID=UPI000FDC6A25|nr:tetratricopeptide repeat protein [Paenibacillus koleovorans]